MDELENIKKEMDKLEIIGYDDYGFSSVESVKATLTAVREYDKQFPVETEMARIRKIALTRRK
ncbi:MAG: hypothetical protein LBP32_07220 [Spirochaetaceae bacterium]|nr:hypothetical protein [Spirochaetaceae bacterium]